MRKDLNGGKKNEEAMQLSFSPNRKSDYPCIAGPRERLIAVEIFAAHFLKALLVLTAAFVVCAEIGSAVLY